MGPHIHLYNVLEYSVHLSDGATLGYTLCRSSSRRMFCSNGFNTMHVVCTDLLCVSCIGLLPAEFSSEYGVNTGLDRPIFWKPLSLLSTHEGLAATNYKLT